MFLQVYGSKHGKGVAKGKGEIDSALLAFDLIGNKWSVLHHAPQLSLLYPEGRWHHRMWAAEGKVWIFGGRTPHANQGGTASQDS